MNKHVVVVGSFIVDLMSQTIRMPFVGETVTGRFKMGPGGKGFNQAVAASRAGSNVIMVVKVGVDMFAEIAIDNFKREGFGLEYCFRDSSLHTGVAHIIVNADGDNMIVVCPGANEALSIDEVERAAGAIANSAVLLVQLEANLETTMHAVELASRAGVMIVLNPAPAREFDISFLEKVDIITPNETEAEHITGIPVKSINDAQRAGTRLLDMGVKAAIITLGAKGALLSMPSRSVHIPPPTVPVVDTTGAGDAFNGGLVTALVEGKGLEEAVVFANLVGALSTTEIGTAPAMPTREEINALGSRLNHKGIIRERRY